MLALDQLLDNAWQHANRSMPIKLSLAGRDGLDRCILEFASQSLDAPVASEDLEMWRDRVAWLKLLKDAVEDA